MNEDEGMLDDEALVTALRELLGPKNEAEQHRRRLAMIAENVRLHEENALLLAENALLLQAASDARKARKGGSE